MASLLQQLKERKLVRWMLAYLAGAFAVFQGVEVVAEPWGISLAVQRAIHVLLLTGLFISMVLAWYHGERGQQRVTRYEVLLIVILLVVGGAASWATQHGGTPTSDLGGLPDPRNLAVLYFEDLSPSEGLAYVADGLTEALIDELSSVRALDVISRNGVAPFRGTDLGLDSVARVLAVGSVVVGSVESVSDEVRVTARLVDGISGADIERTTFSVPAGDFLAARDSVAQRVGRILRQRLGDEVRLQEHRAGTMRVEAWALAQRAERIRKEAEGHLLDGLLHEAMYDFEVADSLLGLAEVADQEWLEPIALRAHTAFRLARTARYLDDTRTALEQIETGLEHANRVLEVEPNHSRALEYRGTLGYLHWLFGMTPDPAERDRIFEMARDDLEAAVRADPTLATAHSILSHLYVNTEDQVGVVLSARRAYEEDAYLDDADQILARLFWGHYNLEQFTEAQRWADEGLRRFPDDYWFVECQLWMMLAEQTNPNVDRARQLATTLEAVTPEDRRPFHRHLAQLIVGGVLGRAGDMDSARVVLTEAHVDPESDPQYQLVLYEAAIRTLIGDHEQAIELLRLYVSANPQAFQAGEETHWWWRPLRDYPRFQALLER